MAQSITKGKGSDEGMPKVIGFVPSIGSTPKVGAIDGRALVPVSPILSITGCIQSVLGEVLVKSAGECKKEVVQTYHPWSVAMVA